MTSCMIPRIAPFYVMNEQSHMLCTLISTGYELDRFASILHI